MMGVLVVCNKVDVVKLIDVVVVGDGAVVVGSSTC